MYQDSRIATKDWSGSERLIRMCNIDPEVKVSPCVKMPNTGLRVLSCLWGRDHSGRLRHTNSTENVWLTYKGRFEIIKCLIFKPLYIFLSQQESFFTFSQTLLFEWFEPTLSEITATPSQQLPCAVLWWAHSSPLLFFCVSWQAGGYSEEKMESLRNAIVGTCTFLNHSFDD